MPWPKDPIRYEQMRKEKSELYKQRFQNKENHPRYGKHYINKPERRITIWLSKLDQRIPRRREISIAKSERSKGKNNPYYGKHPSSEVRRKIGDTHRGVKMPIQTREAILKSRLGKKNSPEHCRRISEANRGKKLSESHRKAISEARIGKPSNRLGVPNTEKFRRQQSERMKERFKNKENHPRYGTHMIIKPESRIMTWFYKLPQRINGKRLKAISLVEFYQSHPHPMYGKHLGYKRKPLSEKAKEALKIIRRHRVIPQKDTKPERMMQIALSLNGIKFEKHKPIVGQPDIFIRPNICVFVDSDYHHANPSKFAGEDVIWKKPRIKTAGEIWAYDNMINHELSKMGYFIIRLWDSDIRKNPQNCAEIVIKSILKHGSVVNNNL